MENTFKELSSLIQEGPKEGKEKLFLEIFDVILSCTGQKEAKQYFSGRFLEYILKFMGPNSVYNNIVYRILINVFSEDDLNEILCANDSITSSLVKLSIHDILDIDSKDADNASMLLSNITRSYKNCTLIFEHLSPQSETLHKIVSAFCVIKYNSNCSLDQLAMVLCNLSQLAEVRNIITQSNFCILQKLVPFMNHDNALRRRGIIGTVHNCAFDSSLHKMMLSGEVDILPQLLLPLAGPEQFDDEDNDKLPIDLQYLPDSKTREPDPGIRKQLLETLNQFCATKFGRQYLRDHNTYIILRELHKWEEDQSALLACENVVDILIRTEDEIGIDHLNTVEIPPDLEEKFNKELDLEKQS